jgi:hypothetical protein
MIRGEVLFSVNLFKVTQLYQTKASSSIYTKYFALSEKHWSIRNQLHWCLDVVFREDSERARKDNSPLNMNTMREMDLSMVKQVKMGRLSLRKKCLVRHRVSMRCPRCFLVKSKCF